MIKPRKEGFLRYSPELVEKYERIIEEQTNLFYGVCLWAIVGVCVGCLCQEGQTARHEWRNMCNGGNYPSNQLLLLYPFTQDRLDGDPLGKGRTARGVAKDLPRNASEVPFGAFIRHCGGWFLRCLNVREVLIFN